jgi:hypothetical protein
MGQIMNQRIIYKTDSGVAVIVPTGELSVTETAKKDVPTGLPFAIVEVSEIPADRTFRNAWDIDEAELTDGVGE